MNKEHTEKLFGDFPGFFRGHDSRDPRHTLMVFGFECGDGWFELIHKLCSDIKTIIDKNPEGSDFMVVQVKEKFGGLRFYCGPAFPEIHDLIHGAEEKSYEICEVCGKSGVLRVSKTGWYRTLCNDCGKDHKVI